MAGTGRMVGVAGTVGGAKYRKIKEATLSKAAKHLKVEKGFSTTTLKMIVEMLRS